MVISLFLPRLFVLVGYGMPWFVYFVLRGSFLFGIYRTVFAMHLIFGICLTCDANVLESWWKKSGRTACFGMAAMGVCHYTARFFMVPYLHNSISDNLLWIATGLGSSLLLIVCMHSRIAKRKISNLYLALLGRLPYSIYPNHNIVLICLVPIFLVGINSLAIMNQNLYGVF